MFKIFNGHNRKNDDGKQNQKGKQKSFIIHRCKRWMTNKKAFNSIIIIPLYVP